MRRGLLVVSMLVSLWPVAVIANAAIKQSSGSSSSSNTGSSAAPSSASPSAPQPDYAALNGLQRREYQLLQRLHNSQSIARDFGQRPCPSRQPAGRRLRVLEVKQRRLGCSGRQGRTPGGHGRSTCRSIRQPSLASRTRRVQPGRLRVQHQRTQQLAVRNRDLLKRDRFDIEKCRSPPSRPFPSVTTTSTPAEESTGSSTGRKAAAHAARSAVLVEDDDHAYRRLDRRIGRE